MMKSVQRLGLVLAALTGITLVLVTIDVLVYSSPWLKYAIYMAWFCSVPGVAWAVTPAVANIEGSNAQSAAKLVGSLFAGAVLVLLSIVVGVNFKFLIGGSL